MQIHLASKLKQYTSHAETSYKPSLAARPPLLTLGGVTLDRLTTLEGAGESSPYLAAVVLRRARVGVTDTDSSPPYLAAVVPRLDLEGVALEWTGVSSDPPNRAATPDLRLRVGVAKAGSAERDGAAATDEESEI